MNVTRHPDNMPRSHAERTLNKTERLFALVLLLQNRPSMTSRDLAEHFKVSRRTIFRDLRALSESGVPLTYADITQAAAELGYAPTTGVRDGVAAFWEWFQAGGAA